MASRLGTTLRRRQSGKSARSSILNRNERRLRVEALEDRRMLALVTVNTFADTVDFNDGVTSLREAIFATNVVGGADTIDFAAALTAGGPATLTLMQGELKITDDLSINGPGANLLKIDASGNDPTPDSTLDDGDATNDFDGSRVFNVDAGPASVPNVSISGLTLTGGDVSGAGGAIRNVENLTVTDVAISGNVAWRGGGIAARSLAVGNSVISGNSAQSEGGGIYAYGFSSVVTVASSRVVNNDARYGGGISARANLTVTASTISSNSASAYGGGIASHTNNLTVTDAVITGNAADSGGGGIFGRRAIAVMNSTINGNSSRLNGGGIQSAGNSSILTVNNSTISDNASTHGNGGGISVGDEPFSTARRATIVGSTISGNTAAGSGGGVYAREADVALTQSTVRNNVAGLHGGGVYGRAAVGVRPYTIFKDMSITASTISGNSAGSAISTAGGGGIFSRGFNLAVASSTVSGNAIVGQFASGGGVFNHYGNPIVANSTIHGNSAGQRGGGLFLYGGVATARHTIVAGNTGNTFTAGRPHDVLGAIALTHSLLGVDAGATITDNGGNLIGTATAPIDPLLAPLADNGGPTQTHALLLGSPAINRGDLSAVAGVNGVPEFDQRGEPFGRVIGGRIDIGAFELQPMPAAFFGDYNQDGAADLADYILWRKALGQTVAQYSGADGSGDGIIDMLDLAHWRARFGQTVPPPPEPNDLNLVVDTLADESDGDYGLGDLSLREALLLANMHLSADTIQFDPGLVASGPAMILLTMGELRITDNTTIVGPGANLLTIDASGNDPTPNSTYDDGVSTNDGDGSRVFNIDDASRLTLKDVVISGLTLTGGDSRFPGGGAILALENLTIADSIITGNFTQGSAIGGGGAIYSTTRFPSAPPNSLTILNSAITGNYARHIEGGGIRKRFGSLVIDGSTISGNRTLQAGGGVSASENVTVVITRSTISGNQAAGAATNYDGGGGLFLFQVNATITDSTISGNTHASGQGAGIYSYNSQLSISNSTISGNQATGGDGGGMHVRAGSLSISHSTITANSASNNGGGISALQNVLLSHTILAGNTRGAGEASDLFGHVTLSFSLLGVNTGSILTDNGGNHIGSALAPIDPLLESLADNGGPTFTHALLPGSPAINRGDLSAVAGVNGVPQFDQRGTPFGRVLNGRIDIGAFEFQEPGDLNLVVDTLVDESDGNYALGDLSLREAILLANTYASIDTIQFAPTLTAGGPTTILLTLGELKITDHTTIVGPGANLLTINASGNDSTPDENNGDGSRVFHIDDGNLSNVSNVSLHGLRLVGADYSGDGGAIFSQENLSITEVTLTENAASVRGGAVASLNGTVTIMASTISGNRAGSFGGAISSRYGTLTVGASTISNNRAGQQGGGVDVFGNNSIAVFDDTILSGNSATTGGAIRITGTGSTLTATNSTISGNSGGGVSSGAASLTFTNSTISSNTGSGVTSGAMNASIAFTDSTISGNTGSGISSTSNTDLTLNASNIASNSVSGVTIFGTATIVASTISNNTGRGIVCSSANVTASTISGNSTGGMFSSATNSSLAITDSVINGNGALTGSTGGVYSRSGNVTVTRSTISGNSTGRHGGGIFGYLSTGIMVVSDSTISGNTARQNGGGIYSRGDLQVAGSTISDNQANGTRYDGGGGILSRRNTTIIDSTITRNTAAHGGGISSLGSSFSSATLTVTGTTISENSATGVYTYVFTGGFSGGQTSSGFGGGIFTNSTLLTVTDCEITSNSARLQGGGIANWRSSATIQGSTISGNSAAGVANAAYRSGDGGGISSFSALTSVVNTTVADNSAGHRGGGLDAYYGSLSVAGSTISGNSVTGDAARDHWGGGGIFTHSALNITNSTISGNSADHDGGGILAEFGATVSDTLITANTATGDGGGLWTNVATITNSNFSGNHADGFGGGVWSSTATITLSTLDGNSAGENGGGIWFGSATIAHSTITGNTAEQNGGGVYIGTNSYNPTNISSSTISGNFATDGGGIWSSTSKFAVMGSTISGNQATGAGGGLYLFSLNPEPAVVRHSTIAFNSAVRLGGGVFVSGAPLEIDHTIIAKNNAALAPDLLSVLSTIDARFSLVGNNQGSTLAAAPVGMPDANGNLVGQPGLLIDPLLGPLGDNGGPTFTHSLLTGSPALDAGNPAAMVGPDMIPETDQRGAPFVRIADSRIDIGAYERQTLTRSNFVVDSLLDESDGDYSADDLTLREAIGLANGSAGQDTITFGSALTTGGPATIRLTDGELVIRDSVSIVGLGADQLTIDASGNDSTPETKNADGSRVLYVSDQNKLTLLDVSLRGMTLTGGDANGSGGAVSSSENLTIVESVITGNAANPFLGGAIYSFNNSFGASSVQPNTLTIIDSTISGNSTSGWGGGIANREGTVTLRNSTVSDNSAGNSGGGIYNSGGSLTLENASVSVNSAMSGGGIFSIGLYAVTGLVTVTQSTIDGNTALNGSGGGISNQGGRFTVVDSNIVNNSALDTGFGDSGGGGISSNGALTLSNTNVSNNAAGTGGGISAMGVVSITDSRIAANHARRFGGGGIKQHGGQITVMNSSITGNTAAGDSGGGAGMYLRDSITTIGRSSISNNSGTWVGGGIWLSSFGYTGIIVDSTISGNSGTTGGGLYSVGADFSITGTTISGNSASVRGGGIATSGQLGLRYSTITGNHAPRGEAGGIASRGTVYDRVQLQSTVVAGNPNDVGFVDGTVNPFVSLGYNLIGTGNAVSKFNQPGDQANIRDPKLGPLTDNGGLTMTHALLADSPALNTGNPSAIAGTGGVPQFDQRGAPFGRVFGGRIDIGAFEWQPIAALLPGDYNQDGAADSGDYVVWRKTLDTSVANYSGADGSGNGVIDQDDLTVWKAHFGQTLALPAFVSEASVSALNFDHLPLGAMPATVTSNRIGSAPAAAIQQQTAVARDLAFAIFQPRRHFEHSAESARRVRNQIPDELDRPSEATKALLSWQHSERPDRFLISGGYVIKRVVSSSGDTALETANADVFDFALTSATTDWNKTSRNCNTGIN
jgi:CSLREA domain-containing protein